MIDIEKARSLLRLARVDHDAMRATTDLPLVADSVFGFHAQQAAEKALKAWLQALDVAYPATHDLARLLQILRDSGADIRGFEHFAEFTIFAVQARYEEGIVTPADPLDRPAVVAEVGALLDRVNREVAAPAP
ncbi:MAG: HEPN domain-containing protein [Rhodocyclaceae bacterium]|nr:HEPN domain-containing protein [Rhodocyclaceae bacterium]